MVMSKMFLLKKVARTVSLCNAAYFEKRQDELGDVTYQGFIVDGSSPHYRKRIASTGKNFQN